MGDGSDVVTVERLIPAPPEAIFDVLADPSRHREIDGSGSVRDAKREPSRLAQGSRFGMAMKIGVPYTTENTVVEFEENRCLAWQTRPRGPVIGRAGGRIWRYELEPRDGGTLVRESWDIRHESALTKPMVRLAATQTRRNMTATLERLERVVAG